MVNRYTCLLAVLLFFVSSCDLNDTKDDNGTFSLYFKVAIDGTNWVGSTHGASLNTSGVKPLVRLHGDLGGTNQYFVIQFPPLAGTDTTIIGNGLGGIVEFHNHPDHYYSTTGSLTAHKTVHTNQHQYNGIFSGTLVNVSNSSTITITNGEYYVQGYF